jgi:HEAT repeat protein
LLRAVGDADKFVRAMAVEALGHLGARAPVEPVSWALEDEDWDVRKAAVEALGRLGERAPIEPLLAALNDPGMYRQTVVRALGALGERAPVTILARVLSEDEYYGVREAAADALGRLGDRAPVEALVHALGDEGYLESVRRAVVRALGQLGARAPIELLVQAMGDTDFDVRAAASEAVARLAPERLAAVGAEAVSILQDGVRDPERVPVLGSIVQTEMAETLGAAGRPVTGYVDYLSRLLDWPYWQVQAAAAKALGHIQRRIPDAAIARLYDLRNDTGQPDAVRFAADDALAAILAVDPMEDDA